MLVLNKAILIEGTVFSQFTYSDELFHACSAVLRELSSTIPQQKLSKELIKTIERKQDRHQTFAKDLLEHLEVILVLLKKTGGDPACSLQKFIRRWATLLPGQFPEDILPEPQDGVKLQHIVHLYETLEDLLVDASINNLQLEDNFRKDIPTEITHSFVQKLKPCTVEKLTQLASTIRRFVFRFLRSTSTIDPNANLKELLLRSLRDSSPSDACIDLIPDELTVSNVAKTLLFINKQIEQREDVLHEKDVRTYRLRTMAAGRQTARKRRGGKVGGIS